jgi:hypothetical protein
MQTLSGCARVEYRRSAVIEAVSSSRAWLDAETGSASEKGPNVRGVQKGARPCLSFGHLATLLGGRLNRRPARALSRRAIHGGLARRSGVDRADLSWINDRRQGTAGDGNLGADTLRGHRTAANPPRNHNISKDATRSNRKCADPGRNSHHRWEWARNNDRRADPGRRNCHGAFLRSPARVSRLHCLGKDQHAENYCAPPLLLHGRSASVACFGPILRLLPSVVTARRLGTDPRSCLPR